MCSLMVARPSFDKTAPIGRFLLLLGAYAPVLAVLGLRHGLDGLGIVLCVAACLGSVVWLTVLLVVVRRRQVYELTLRSAEPMDRDVTAYVASYLLPVLAAKPSHATGYIGYGLVAFLVLIVAYRADLGAINPLAYMFRYRAYRVSAEDGATIILSKSALTPGTTWQVQQVAGIAVARKQTGKRTTESNQDRS